MRTRRCLTGLLLATLWLLAAPAPAQRLYWEDPRVIVPAGVRFLSATSGGGLVVVMWQEVIPAAGGGGQIYLSLRSSRDGRVWRESLRFAGPYRYQERIVPIYSLAMDDRGGIFVSTLTAEREVTILASTDEGRSFATLAAVESLGTTLAPGLFVTARGGLLLFVTQESREFLAVHYALSEDGRRWSAFQPLVDDAAVPISFRPAHAVLNGRDYVVFQGLAIDTAGPADRTAGNLPYQLYATQSGDGGVAWTRPLELGFPEAVAGREWAAEFFINQRPFVMALEDRLALVWERQFQSNPTQVYYAELGSDGDFALAPEPATRGSAASYFPRLVALRGRLWLFWFDSTDQVFAADRRGVLWEPRRLSTLPGSSFFPHPVVVGEQLYVFWENRLGAAARMVLLEPDQSVAPPAVRPLDFDPGSPSRQERVRVGWSLPRDSSGIAGVGYVWTQDPEEPVPRQLRQSADTTSVELETDSDGRWYFRIVAADFAGNWSEPVTISYLRDTVPPPTPQLALPRIDEDGYLASNTFSVSWEQPQPAEDLVGYVYTLRLVGAREAPEELPELTLPRRPETRATRVSYRNQDDGVWLFGVAAVDRAGNVSPPATAVLRLNKYVPVTFITRVDVRTDPSAGISLSITGRGFSVGGAVEEVILDRDGQAPYEYVYQRSDGDFTVAGDRLIRDLTVMDIRRGQYRVGVRHPVRGLAWSPVALSFESLGTIKYGDFTYQYPGRWQSAARALQSVSASRLALWLVMAFLAAALFVSARRLVSLAQEGRVLQNEVLAVLRGEVSIDRKEQRMEQLKRKGASLRLKFTLVTMALVLMTVTIVAVPLGFYMIERQRENLAEGLKQRAEVLLGSIAAGAENYLPTGNVVELGLLPRQVASMEEAVFITVTGPGRREAGDFDYLWASNDPDLEAKLRRDAVDTDTPGPIGQARIEDEVTGRLAGLREQINQEARRRVANLAEQAGRLGAEGGELAVRTDAASRERLRVLQEELSRINEQISVSLQDLKDRGGSVPEYDIERELLPLYTFFRPIVYRQPREEEYYRGAVRLGVSTDKIRAELQSSTRTLIVRTGIIALVAAGLGLAGAIAMASITVNPIRKLHAGVTVVRDTDDKAQLEGYEIDVRSKDEIGSLAATFNQMTQGLVRAAKDSKEMTVAKDVQRQFIPLTVDSNGRKGTTAGEDTKNLEIFGYYEGAKGVSGDYFDYRKLNDRYYAMIKCDVAGKGAPAALIMVEVATIFSTYFRNWTLENPGLMIEKLAALINDMLEERGFKGRFAAFTLAIIDGETGNAHLCNAGDTKLHVYRQAQKRMVEYTLPDTPAAGIFPTMMIDMKGGFQRVPQKLLPGDILFLFTDGIEDGLGEEKRLMGAPGGGSGESGESASPAVAGEAKGVAEKGIAIQRIYEIIDSVLNRRRYTLTGHHNPALKEDPSFDFTRCRGTVEEAVLALVSVERILRVLPEPGATAEDRVRVDRRIDAFLQEHFEQYGRYLTHRVESEEAVDTVTFSHLLEDEQYDDLTILVTRKK